MAELPAGVHWSGEWAGVAGAERRGRLFGSDAWELSCDVVVVGSGAGGSVVAAELAEAGLDVVVLEEGGYHPTSSFTPRPGQMIPRLYRDGGVQATLGNPPVSWAEGRCVGGSTVINGGMSWRTPARVLEGWAREHGLEGGDPAAMEPYFERVERFIHTGHQDPWTVGRDNQLLKEAADKLGWKVIPNLRNQLHCAGSNVCAFGCPTGAKRSALVSYLPRALHFGARILAGARVERLLRERKLITGVEGRLSGPEGGPGARFRVHAAHVFVCAGAIQTPALLARSGVRPPSGRLGHGLTLHPNVKVLATFEEQVEGWKGVHQAFQVREFQEEGYLMAAINLPPSIVAMTLPRWGAELHGMLRDYARCVVAGVLIEDTVSGRVRTVAGQPLAFYSLSDQDLARIMRGTELVCRAMFAAGARRIVLPFEGAPTLEGPDDLRLIHERPVPRSAMEVVTVHVMGTAAAGGDPTRHVCDSYGRVYDTAGLWLADASLFPTPIGVNPMETIMALATRNAERVLDAGAARRPGGDRVAVLTR